MHEAIENNLIVSSWDDKQEAYVEGKWSLVSEIDRKSYATREEFTTIEAQGLINLLERVRSGLCR